MDSPAVADPLDLLHSCFGLAVAGCISPATAKRGRRPRRTGLTDATGTDGFTGAIHPAALGDGTDRRADGGNQAVENPGTSCGNRSATSEKTSKSHLNDNMDAELALKAQTPHWASIVARDRGAGPHKR